MKTRRLITSALPYVNNIPHLGNLIQMLSADVYARFCRSYGYDTLYICGTDEYGTATEKRALEENKTPRELCDYYYNIHDTVYKWFNISFDKFGRTSNEQCTEITQDLFNDLDKNGYIKEHTNKQLFCPTCKSFLADRFVRGICPKCGFEDARGDQCDKCGALLDPIDLKQPKCDTCGTAPEVKETKHLYIDLPSVSKKLDSWMETTSKEGRWSENAINTTKAWIRDGLNERAITRDLKWGIPVPKDGYENKVFYVWFNAPIGYMSITKQLSDELIKAGRKSFDWKAWWLPEESSDNYQTSLTDAKVPVQLFQFIGKDNIPFHTVIFPSTLLGSGKNWTKLFHMSSSEYLNYESGKFSKSRGIGVFGTDAMESGILADAWRFYIFFNRPEKQDYQFTWKDFREKYNGELIGNLGNLVNRTLLFINKYYEGKVPEAPLDEELWAKVKEKEAKITELLDWAELKDAFHEIFALSDLGNKAFQDCEPWKTRNTDPEKAATLIHTLAYLIKDLMILANPYMPQYTQTVMSFLGKSIASHSLSTETIEGLDWNDLGKTTGLDKVGTTSVYFTPIDQKTADNFREKFSGSQAERKETEAKKENKQQSKQEKKKKPEPEEPKLAENQIEWFKDKISLKVAKIIKIENNPEGEKLYVEHLDDGSGTPRIIQSGLRPYLQPEDLLGKHIILAANLAPRKMRGIESHGMLLAADYKDENGKDCVEVLEAPWAQPGTNVVLEGQDPNAAKPETISIDDFFSIKMEVKNKDVICDGVKLVADGKPLSTKIATDSEVC